MKVQFLKNTAEVEIDKILPDTILLYRDGYNLPKLKDIRYIEFEKYRTQYSDLHCNMMILVGLNRMINPSNRCDFVHDYLTSLTPNIPKISIDTAPFIGEPWRLFWHYLYTKTGHFSVNYSYPVEGEWQKWFYREVNFCNISGDNIKLLISDTYSDLDQLITKFKFYEPNDLDVEYYAEVKKFVFEKYDTPKLLVSNILKQCNKHFQVNLDYDSYLTNREFMLPDLKIYQFIVEENQRRMDIYNAVIQ